MTFQRVVAHSGLTKSELAYLYGVSRQTIYDWADGKRSRKPSYTVRIAETITAVLVSAIDRHILPLKPMSRDARAAGIARLAKTLQDLKPAPIK
jgi:DNA-binding XRE family transcriptional regulator